MENELLKRGDIVEFISHNFNGEVSAKGIGKVVHILERDYMVKNLSSGITHSVSIPGKRKRCGGFIKDTISLIEEEN